MASYDKEGNFLSVWGTRVGLTSGTIKVLRKEGFTSYKDLSFLSTEDVEKLKGEGRIPLKDCNILKLELSKFSGKECRLKAGEGEADVAEKQSQPESFQTSLHWESYSDTSSLWEKEYHLVLIGREGSGKKSTGNTILGKKTFTCQPPTPLMTNKNDTSSGTLQVTVCLPDREGDQTSIHTALRMRPHAIVFLVALGDFQRQDLEVFQHLKQNYGTDISDFIVVGFSKGDILPNQSSKDILRNAPADLKSLVDECGGRYVIFNNKASVEDKRSQVKSLLKVLEGMIHENGGELVIKHPEKLNICQASQPTELKWKGLTDKGSSDEDMYKRLPTKKRGQAKGNVRNEVMTTLQGKVKDLEENMSRLNAAPHTTATQEHASLPSEERQTPAQAATRQGTTYHDLSSSFVNRPSEMTSSTVATATRGHTTGTGHVPQTTESEFGHAAGDEYPNLMTKGNAMPCPSSYQTHAGETFRFLLLGKTGSGKSTTGNTILGEKMFVSASNFSSVTSKPSFRENTLNGIHIQILDCPGLCDTSKSDEDVAIIIMKAVIGMHPGPHAVLYVLKAERFTDNEYQVFKKLESLFDERLFDYLVVIITGGDNFEFDGRTPEEAIRDAPPTLTQLLSDCSNRYVVFNNRAPDRWAQTSKLLSLVRKMIVDNQPNPHYKCDKYKRYGEGLEAAVRQRVAKVEKELLEKQQGFQAKISEITKEKEEELKKMEMEYKEKVSKQEMSEEEAKTKLEERERANKEKMSDLQRQLDEMKEKDKKTLRDTESKTTTEAKKEAVESPGFIEKVKNGAKSVGGGLLDIAMAPFEKVSSWFS